jgi:hypothetical protein
LWRTGVVYVISKGLNSQKEREGADTVWITSKASVSSKEMPLFMPPFLTGGKNDSQFLWSVNSNPNSSGLSSFNALEQNRAKRKRKISFIVRIVVIQLEIKSALRMAN